MRIISKILKRNTRNKKKKPKRNPGATLSYYSYQEVNRKKDNYNFIVEELKCKAFIPINPRNTKANKIFSKKGILLCEAGLEMKSGGSWQEGLRKRLKFRCPLKTDKLIAASHPDGCPVNNPRFNTDKAYGCTKYLDITDDARSQVPRDSISA